MIFDRANPGFLLRSTNNDPCAAFIKESRMMFAEPTNLDRKSGVAQWSDLRLRCQLQTHSFDLDLRFPGRHFRWENKKLRDYHLYARGRTGLCSSQDLALALKD